MLHRFSCQFVSIFIPTTICTKGNMGINCIFLTWNRWGLTMSWGVIFGGSDSQPKSNVWVMSSFLLPWKQFYDAENSWRYLIPAQSRASFLLVLFSSHKLSLQNVFLWHCLGGQRAVLGADVNSLLVHISELFLRPIQSLTCNTLLCVCICL